MNTKELRRGNLVQDIHGTIKYVEQIFEKGVQIYSVDNESDSSFYQEEEIFGIPLTEELVLMFGFNILSISNKTHYGLGSLTLTEDFRLYLIDQEDEIKSVHQLQNLYFALYQRELTYKP